MVQAVSYIWEVGAPAGASILVDIAGFPGISRRVSAVYLRGKAEIWD